MNKRITIFLGLLIISTLFIEAKTVEMRYSFSFGILGQLGIANITIETKDNRYTIDVESNVTGFAKVFGSNRGESHISRGHIDNGMLISDSYNVIKTLDEWRGETVYKINHKSKKVTKSYKKFKGDKCLVDRKTVLDYYSSDDVLSLYINIPKLVNDKNETGVYHIKAVGAERQGGKVGIEIPEPIKIKEYEKLLGKGNYWYISAITYQRIFSSKDGAVMLAIDRDNIVQKAVMEDLFLYGDLVLERIK